MSERLFAILILIPLYLLALEGAVVTFAEIRALLAAPAIEFGLELKPQPTPEKNTTEMKLVL